uniref:SJCHGC07390 protein n=1 Tax=Schistosoma japonicum TaxID=6182 RepID=Q5BRU1_SCHJA|nr:SJCHGC07390 protein [Schistosoma japonicum]
MAGLFIVQAQDFLVKQQMRSLEELQQFIHNQKVKRKKKMMMKKKRTMKKEEI